MKKRKADAVVIGSGVGGLCTAARLVHGGMKVVVLERLPFLGGRLSTRVVKGFKLPTGATIVPYAGNSTFRETFDLFGLSMNVRGMKGQYRYRLRHGDFELPPGGGGLMGMLRFALRDEARAKRLSAHFVRALSWWEPSDEISFKEWLSQYTDDEDVHGLFQGFCAAYIGVNSNETPAGEFFRFFKAMGRNIQYGIAVNGNVELMDSLAAAIAERGGVVEKESSCRSIIVEGPVVRGVVAEREGKSEVIEAPFVVSNMGPRPTVGLAGPGNFEKSYLALMEAHPFTVPVIYICIGSREPLYDCAGVLNLGNTRRLCFMETPTLTCPELAPEGRHLAVTYSVPQVSTAPLRFKESIELALLDIQENFPGFREEGELLHIGTHHDDWPTMHRWPGYPMPVRTPIENLYNVGDGCMPRGTVGVEACAQSAKIVAGEILQRA